MNEIKVLDKGFVRLIDVMGGDLDVEQAARVSYHKGTRQVSDTTKLIRSLVRDGHSSPLEQVEFKFHIKVPLYIFGQIVRHRTASMNVRSYRYSEFEDGEFNYLPKERYVKQDKSNKQASGSIPIFTDEEFDDFEQQQEYINGLQNNLYKKLIEKGCAREVARIHLPQSAYTELFWKMDLKNLLHFLKLRLHEGAQPEIQEYAKAISYFVEHKCPICWQAFKDYELDSVRLTRKELASIRLDRTTEDELKEDGYNNKEIQLLLKKLEG